jgi:hypothetical protein
MNSAMCGFSDFVGATAHLEEAGFLAAIDFLGGRVISR